VREVMLDMMNLCVDDGFGEGRGKCLMQALRLAALAQALRDKPPVGPVLQQESEALGTVYAWIKVDGNVLQFSQLDAGFPEAELDRLRGQPGPVLDAAQALFFDGGDEDAVLDDGSG